MQPQDPMDIEGDYRLLIQPQDPLDFGEYHRLQLQPQDSMEGRNTCIPEIGTSFKMIMMECIYS